MKRAEEANTTDFGPRLGDFLGQVIAMRLVGHETVQTEYGEQTVGVVDVATLEGDVYLMLYCFWKAVKAQVAKSPHEWIAGLLSKDGQWYVLDASKVSDSELSRLERVTAGALEPAPPEDDEIPF